MKRLPLAVVETAADGAERFALGWDDRGTDVRTITDQLPSPYVLYKGFIGVE